MHFSIVTLFPEMFKAFTDYGVSSRAVKSAQVILQCFNPRDFATDRHRTVDDRPYGGGPGMLMKTGPLLAAIKAARNSHGDAGARARVIYLSPQGKRLEQQDVRELAADENLILLCGRYEGIDERVISSEVDAEYSIGDFVISGGELAAMVVMDAIMRTLPGVLGHEDSAAQDSFAGGLLDCPHYTRPEEFEGQRVPAVLLSGDHAMIARWRLQQSLGATWRKRPDLLGNLQLDAEQQRLLDEYIREYQEERTRHE